MAKYQKVSVSIIDALAVAVHIYRKQGNKVTKFDYDTNLPGNKELIYDYFAAGTGNIHQDPDLIETALTIRSAIGQRITVNILTGVKNNDFLVTVNALLERDNITSKDFGLLAWAPKLSDDMSKADTLKEAMISAGTDSKHIGTIGKKIAITFNEITTRFLPMYNSYVHSGKDDEGNLVSFWNKNQIPNGSKITAKVKGHAKNPRIGDALVTNLNYVKVAR